MRTRHLSTKYLLSARSGCALRDATNWGISAARRLLWGFRGRRTGIALRCARAMDTDCRSAPPGRAGRSGTAEAGPVGGC